jgi:hypothetical protein
MWDSRHKLSLNDQTWEVSVQLDCVEEVEVLQEEKGQYWILPLIAHDFWGVEVGHVWFVSSGELELTVCGSICFEGVLALWMVSL